MKNGYKLIPFEKIEKAWMKDPEIRREYERLQPEFEIARQIIDARINGKMTQEEIARKAKTGQAVISRLETMNASPSLDLLQRVAHALGKRLEINFK